MQKSFKWIDKINQQQKRIRKKRLWAASFCSCILVDHNLNLHCLRPINLEIVYPMLVCFKSLLTISQTISRNFCEQIYIIQYTVYSLYVFTNWPLLKWNWPALQFYEERQEVCLLVNTCVSHVVPKKSCTADSVEIHWTRRCSKTHEQNRQH